VNAADRTTEDADLGAEHSGGSHDQPLSAQWRPDVTSQGTTADRARTDGPRDPSGKSPRGRLRRLAATYGWRLYAVPVLFVITVLVIVDTVHASGETPAQQSPAAGKTSSESARTTSPAATENRPTPEVPDDGTAELPPGGDFTAEGKGSWEIVPGSSDPVGDGDETFTYTVEVEKGIDAASYAGDKAFAQAVEAVLSDPRGWTGDDQVSLERVDDADAEPDFRVSLTSPETDHQPALCGYSIEYEASCYNATKGRVVINLARWVRGAKAFNGDLSLYRQYAINHEVGHALGNGHAACPEDDELAPVMMQQTFGVANDYVAELNHSTSPVPADGKVCEPNAWPNPGESAAE